MEKQKWHFGCRETADPRTKTAVYAHAGIQELCCLLSLAKDTPERPEALRNKDPLRDDHFSQGLYQGF